MFPTLLPVEFKGGISSPARSHRTASPCFTATPDIVSIRQVKFAGESDNKRQLPWPEVPDEMIAFLQAKIDWLEAERVKRGDPSALVWAPYDSTQKAMARTDIQSPPGMELSENDIVVYRIMGGRPLNDIRGMYGLEKEPTPQIEIPGVATLSFKPSYGNEQARETLADAISAIQNDDLKNQWIDFMMNDPYVHTQSAVVKQYATLSSQEMIDAKAIELSKMLDGPMPEPSPFGLDNHGALTGFARGLNKVSPKLRWDLINKLRPWGRYNGDLWLHEVVKSYSKSSNPDTDPTVVMLQAWLRDQDANDKAKRLLAQYDKEKHSQPRSWDSYDHTENEHTTFARDIAREIRSFNNQELKESWLKGLQQMTATPGNYTDLAKDILVDLEYWQTAGQPPNPANTAETRAWKEQMEAVRSKASPLAQGYFSHWVAYHLKNQEDNYEFEQEYRKKHKAEKPDQWTPAQMAVFEAELRN